MADDRAVDADGAEATSFMRVLLINAETTKARGTLAFDFAAQSGSCKSPRRTHQVSSIQRIAQRSAHGHQLNLISKASRVVSASRFTRTFAASQYSYPGKPGREYAYTIFFVSRRDTRPYTFRMMR
jgi:hypothetical protein